MLTTAKAFFKPKRFRSTPNREALTPPPPPDPPLTFSARRSPVDVDHIKPYPEIPADVLRLILETSARTSQSTAARLCLLSREIYPWICQILYSTPVLHHMRYAQITISAFARTIREAPHLAKIARRISCGPDSSDDVVEWLGNCTNLTVLALFLYFYESFHSRVILPLPPSVKQLTCDLRWFSLEFDITPHSLGASDCAVFDNITHLHLFESPRSATSNWTWLTQPAFPSLTHLTIEHGETETFDFAAAAERFQRHIDQYLTRRHLLVVCVLVLDPASNPLFYRLEDDNTKVLALVQGLMDPRVVVAVTSRVKTALQHFIGEQPSVLETSFGEMKEEWDPYYTKATLWARAEDVVKGRAEGNSLAL